MYRGDIMTIPLDGRIPLFCSLSVKIQTLYPSGTRVQTIEVLQLHEQSPSEHNVETDSQTYRFIEELPQRHE